MRGRGRWSPPTRVPVPVVVSAISNLPVPARRPLSPTTEVPVSVPRSLLAIVLGVIAGVLVVMLVKMLSMMLFPMPAGATLAPRRGGAS